MYPNLPKGERMPYQINYSLGILVRNTIFMALFYFVQPSDINLDYLSLMKSGQMFVRFICPCGETGDKWEELARYKYHKYTPKMHEKNQQQTHEWLVKCRSAFLTAIRGWESDNRQVRMVSQDEVNYCFKKVWRENVLPRYKDDYKVMEKLKWLYKLHTCFFRIKVGRLRPGPRTIMGRTYQYATSHRNFLQI